MTDDSSSKGIDSIMSSGEPPGRGSEFADQLRGLGQDQQSILDAIDNLRPAMLEELQLPQLVVVGDQSAGKSSVLDAISGIPIPKHPDGCTRFATEFRLRRGNAGISISIIPDKNRTDKRREELSKIAYRSKDTAQLDSFISQCEQAIFDGDETDGGKFASRDIVKIEIWGPKMPLLTLVDLPGLIQAPNTKQTPHDIVAINDIALDYMSSERTIILAVVAGGTDFVNQVVLNKFLVHDKGGVRTLGIVTKPDLVSGIAIEEKFLKLVKNENIKLDLGWHVLRNRTPQEKDISAKDRNRNENDFFTKGKWGTLPPGTYGVESLVAKLSLILYNHITDCFPQLLKEIKEVLKRSEEELCAMGRRVDNESEMLVQVSTLFSDSQSLIESGIRGSYPGQHSFFRIWNSEGFSQISSRNLRARIRLENIEFEKDIRIRGCQVRLVGKEDENHDLEDAHSEDSPSRVNMEVYETKTVQVYLDTYVGQHLPGDYDPLVVYHLFADYSARWDSIARNYKDKMQGIVNEFLQQVVNFVWPQRMRTQLWSFLGKKIEVIQARASEELERLLLDRRRCSPIYGPEYPRRLKELQVSSALEKMSPAREILQRMLVYYELASKIFISNVIVQVAERHLVEGLHTVFDTAELMQMDKATVLKLAAEDSHSKIIRDRLEEKVKKLKKARDDCLAVAMAKGQNTVRLLEPDVVTTADSKREDLAMVKGKNPAKQLEPDVVTTADSKREDLAMAKDKDPAQQLEPDVITNEDSKREDLAMVKDKPPAQQLEPDVVKANSGVEGLDKPAHVRHRKQARSESNGRHTPSDAVTRSIPEGVTNTPHPTVRLPTKAQKAKSRSEDPRRVPKGVSVESEEEPDKDRQPRTDSRNSVINRGERNRSSSADQDLKRAYEVFSDNEDENLVYN